MNEDKIIRINRYDYAYSTGRISVLKTKLMDQNKMSRLFDARSIDEFARILQDSGYVISESIEESIENSLIDSYEQVGIMIPDHEYIEALMLMHDFHNMKVVLKTFLKNIPQRENETSAREIVETPDNDADIMDIMQNETKTITFKDVQPLFAYPSGLDPKILFDAMRDRNLKNLDPFYRDTINMALKRYRATSEPGEIDLVADNRYFIKLHEYAKALGNDFFTAYCVFRSESTNLGTLLRTRLSGSGKPYLSRALVTGGVVSRKTLEDLYDGHDEEIIKAYRNTSCERLSESVPGYGKENSAAQFGKQIDMTILKMMESAKFFLFGPEQLISYLVVKEIQTRNINIALTCIRNRVPMSVAHELMREF
ncbi:MAG: V-type ATPase subunit [Saccharofermentanales bacterium]